MEEEVNDQPKDIKAEINSAFLDGRRYESLLLERTRLAGKYEYNESTIFDLEQKYRIRLSVKPLDERDSLYRSLAHALWRLSQITDEELSRALSGDKIYNVDEYIKGFNN